MTGSTEEEKILIRETFLSLQGEGYFTGKPAFFIRFAGCDIGCVWCDTKDAWSAENSSSASIDEIISLANESKGNYVVITGGEPFLHRLDLLTNRLKHEGKFIHIETCGAYSFGNACYDWISLSPKKIMPPVPENYAKASELKIIVQDKSDLEYAQQEKSKISNNCKLYLQPQWQKTSEIIPVIMEFIHKNPEWRLSLQTHKYLNIK